MDLTSVGIQSKISGGTDMKELVRWMSVPLSCFSLPDVQVGEMEHLHSFFKLYYFYLYLYGIYTKNIL